MRLNATDDAPALTVEAVENHVYFYSEINPDRALALMRLLRETDAHLRNERITRNLPSETVVPIWLHLNSLGGEAFSSFAIADQIERLQTPIYSVVEGV